MSALLAGPLWVPVTAAALVYLLGGRVVALAGVATACATSFLAVLLALRVHHDGATSWQAPLGLEFYADGLAVFMLLLTASIGLAVAVYASAYFQDERTSKRFWLLWLPLWGGMNALYLSADLLSLYLCLELVGLTSWLLIVLARQEEALAAARRYLLAMLLGSGLLLLGLALLYAGSGTLQLALLVEAVTPGRTVSAAVTLLVLGLLVKGAIFPFHFWLPGAHASAPVPVSALLSALVVKTAFFVLLRLWLQVFTNLDLGVMAQGLATLGALAVFYGSWQAFRQRRLKFLIAYSTVVQLGYLMFFFPLATSPDLRLTAYYGMAYHLLAHALVKAALFLASGAMIHALGHDRLYGLRSLAKGLPITTFVIAIAGASLAGLPPSGGFVAKWLLLSAALGSGQWWWAAALLVGGLFTAGYVFRELAITLWRPKRPQPLKPVPRRLEWTALLLALSALLLGLYSSEPLALLKIGSGL